MQGIALPLVLLYFVYRCLRDARYWATFGERLGGLPGSFQRTAHGAIWLHAVSVGEIAASAELIRSLRGLYPQVKVFVSTTTLAGRETAEKRLQGLAAGIFYAPVDYRFAVHRVLRKLRPSLVVVLETEIWPNLYREVKRSGCRLAVVNARISDRAFPRYQRFRWFFSRVLRMPDVILAQSECDRERFAALGAPEARVRVGGNLKYDFTPSAADVAPVIEDFIERTAPSAIWIAASTMPPRAEGDVEEDDVVIEAFRKISDAHSKLLLLLVPRRPELFDAAASKLEAAGIRFVRRSALNEASSLQLPGALLLDSIGELSALFAKADVVFMGGTLARRGGHNVVEPAFFAKPVIVGPHMENFAEIASEFHAGNALLGIADPADLAPAVERLLNDPDGRKRLGEAAQKIAFSKRGVTERLAEEMLALTFRSVPWSMPSVFSRALLWPLSRLWKFGGLWDQERKRASRRRLDAPVICIGNVTLGGSGKTPMVQYLAEHFHNRGRTPLILTRGYGRRSAEPSIIVPRGTPVPTGVTGDEAQMYVRRGAAAVGIGSNRFETALLARKHLDPEIYLLDDGLQHWELHRDLDVVLIDALDPFGGGWIFPLGRLRESMAALQRAGIFVITRTEPGVRTDGIEAELRRVNPTAPIFRSRVVPEHWIELDFGLQWLPDGLPHKKAAAFCGLANPRSFWRTLENLGIEIVYEWAFEDHHHYRPNELRRVAAQAIEAGAEVVVTTEKDVMNLCDNASQFFAPLKLCWLRIAVAMEKEDEFLKAVDEKLGVEV